MLILILTNDSQLLWTQGTEPANCWLHSLEKGLSMSLNYLALASANTSWKLGHDACVSMRHTELQQY